MKIPFLDTILQFFRIGTVESRLIDEFDRRQAALQEQFFQAASGSGRPRGLRWVKCDWRPERVLLRDTETGEICLLVSVGISFEAEEGSDMEHVAAVSQLRDACAVFQFVNRNWQAGGRVLFNMDPGQAADRLGTSWERLPTEPVR